MIKRQELSLGNVKIFVLDEADEMLSRGFKDQIYDVFQHLPAKVQVCLFSATMPEEILEISQRFMRNPVRILVKRDELTLEGIKQFYIAVEREDWKLETLCDLYETLTITQAIIYCLAHRAHSRTHARRLSLRGAAALTIPSVAARRSVQAIRGGRWTG